MRLLTFSPPSVFVIFLRPATNQSIYNHNSDNIWILKYRAVCAIMITYWNANKLFFYYKYQHTYIISCCNFCIICWIWLKWYIRMNTSLIISPGIKHSLQFTCHWVQFTHLTELYNVFENISISSFSFSLMHWSFTFSVA